MKGHKQMCWCLKVFCGVLTNLANRLYSQLLDFLYTMCSFCCWCCKKKRKEEYFGECELKESKEDFYREVGREKAEDLLKDRQCGTFVIRPSKNCNLGTLSVVQDNKVFHLNMRRRGDGLVALGTEKDNEKCFQDVNSLINYYISNYLVLYSKGEKTLTLLLPYREKIVV